MSRLVELNGLVPGQLGILSHPERVEKEFGYSDGSAEEQYLFRVLRESSDLASDSGELQSKILDWPSEYHLSGKRANLLRPFDLASGSRVLELGCGCGAISRYLGECGLEVDAIEGSEVRASLARLRCRDLESVDIIHANFNLIDLPDGEYDYVLLVGVVEYARRFMPGCDDDVEAVTGLLTRVRDTLKSDGRLLVAIENRTGMKYLHGAHEDHYSLRYVGVDDYHESAGIRTYTRGEWRDIAARTGFARPEFYYPFPDYKIPEVVLSAELVDNCPNAWCHLEGIQSDDYTFLFDPYVPETLVWQGYNAAGVMGDMANSFLLCLSKPEAGTPFSTIDFAHLPDYRRKREYLTTIVKYRDEPIVRRKNHVSGEETTEQYLEGPLLSSRWARDLLIYAAGNRFADHIGSYLTFIVQYADTYGMIPLDLLPNNIILSAEGDYLVFDQEWAGVERGDSGYMLFRALLTFATHYRPAIRGFCRRRGLYDVEAFIRFGFTLARIDRIEFQDYCVREDEFQDRVLLERATRTSEVLGTPLMESPVSALVYPMIYWSTAGSAFDDANRVGLEVRPTPESGTLRFGLPHGLETIGRLRFDPCDENRPDDSGFLNLESVRILAVARDGSSERVVWELAGQSLILAQSEINQMILLADEGLLAVTGDDPNLVFEPRVTTLEARERFVVEIDWRFTLSVEYRLARHHYLEREQALLNKVEAMRIRIERAQHIESDLARIKASRIWRILAWLKRLRGT